MCAQKQQNICKQNNYLQQTEAINENVTIGYWKQTKFRMQRYELA